MIEPDVRYVLGRFWTTCHTCKTIAEEGSSGAQYAPPAGTPTKHPDSLECRRTFLSGFLPQESVNCRENEPSLSNLQNDERTRSETFAGSGSFIGWPLMWHISRS